MRYTVHYPMDEPTVLDAGSTNDLEEAGRIYLSSAGASDIYDNHERRWIHPEIEINCVVEAYRKSYRRQQWHKAIAELSPIAVIVPLGTIGHVITGDGLGFGIGVALGFFIGWRLQTKLKRRWGV